MTEYDDYAQNQRDMLRGTSMGRRVTAAPVERDWPHVPRPVCDRCDRDAEPGSALCRPCEDREPVKCGQCHGEFEYRDTHAGLCDDCRHDYQETW